MEDCSIGLDNLRMVEKERTDTRHSLTHRSRLGFRKSPKLTQVSQVSEDTLRQSVCGSFMSL